MTTYKWNPRAVPSTRTKKRVFHTEHCRYLRTSNYETGETPPSEYFPCEHCCRISTRKRDIALLDLHQRIPTTVQGVFEQLGPAGHAHNGLTSVFRSENRLVIVREPSSMDSRFRNTTTYNVDNALRVLGLPDLNGLRKIFSRFEGYGAIHTLWTGVFHP